MFPFTINQSIRLNVHLSYVVGLSRGILSYTLRSRMNFSSPTHLDLGFRTGSFGGVTFEFLGVFHSVHPDPRPRKGYRFPVPGAGDFAPHLSVTSSTRFRVDSRRNFDAVAVQYARLREKGGSAHSWKLQVYSKCVALAFPLDQAYPLPPRVRGRVQQAVGKECVMSTDVQSVVPAAQQNQAAAGGDAGGGASMGKGAWDCDNNCEIPPEKEAEVFEEIATMEFDFEGIPTIPPRKNMTHMAFFCDGCRYRVEAYPDWTAAQVKQALFKGGIQRANNPNRVTPGINKWEDIDIIYAGQNMKNDKKLTEYNVPPGCKTMVAIEGAKLAPGAKPDPDSAYWN